MGRSVMKERFVETQKFTQWWLWVFLLAMACIPVYGLIQQLIMDQPFGNKPMSDTGLIVFGIGYMALLGFFWYMELRTEIDPRGIRFRLRPFSPRHFRWDEIERVETLTYGFVGYGLRLSPKYGTVYNVRGNKGLAIHLKNGRRYLVGTQYPERIEETLKALGRSSAKVG